jgi:hypothetical protein
MRRSIGLIAIAVAAVACGPSPATLAPSPAPSTAAVQLVVDCETGFDQATCDKVVTAALRVVAPSGWTATHVWISSGSLAPIVDLLFDPNANFPAPLVPEGGTNLGSAEVAFAESDRHAGMNLAVVGVDVVANLIGYAVPRRGWCSGTCPSSSSSDGPYTLELTLPHLDWKVDEPILGSATLSFGGAAPTTIYGSGSSILNFAYAEVGGTRKVDPVWTADCGPHPLDPATPINEPLSTSGGFSNDDPNAAFLREFLTDPDVRLPSGTWDITAKAYFADQPSCAGATHSIGATLRITVTN